MRHFSENEMIVHPKNSMQKNALEIILKAMEIPYQDETAEDIYNPEFVNKIRKARKEQADGEGIPLSLEEFQDLCK